MPVRSRLREFNNGTVVYNPMGNGPVAVVFSEPRICVATGKTAAEHQLQSPDGGVYLKQGLVRRKAEEE